MVETVHFVEMALAMLEKIVHLVQPTVGHAQLPLRIVGMGIVMEENHVHHVQEIVDRVLHHLQLHFVEMALVALEKIVDLVLMIVLGLIHASIVLPQTGKHPLGWNVVHHVEIQQHGFQNLVKVVVAHYKISQCPLHIIMASTFHHVHVPLLDPIVEMVHVMEPKRVELALEIVEHVHLHLEQELKPLPIRPHKHPLALELELELHPIHPLALEQELKLHPILLHKHPLEQGPLLKHRPIPRPILLHKHRLAQGRQQRLEHKHPLEQGRHPIHRLKHQLAQERPQLPLQKPIHPLHLQHHQVRQHQKRLHLPTQRAQPVALLLVLQVPLERALELLLLPLLLLQVRVVIQQCQVKPLLKKPCLPMQHCLGLPHLLYLRLLL